ncbi:heme-dependent oxidative N-demethylase family protein [Pararhizobium antarcticum]|uniref:NADH dehydrogenase n=1 Tax=Pararhizobium antarcticum TaxID=1798805 RepID=A0A657LU84_9HYPH|nr:DUF3445 domain-containing protein [Pararhizobium antarcticum]OJF94515.1 NADH dehydrogenase [Pararhizobium antarcticum]OJF96655.1 NADH dehydrogenase [Rhizobium sp. 58]
MPQGIANTPAYTPYDGSSKPFTIGLAQLEPARWILPDAQLGAYLNEKKRLLETYPDVVFVAELATQDAQREVLDMLVAFLPAQYPDLYRCDGQTMEIGKRTVDLAADPALVTAGFLVKDDLVIMRRKETGWHLVAAFVAFPSSWSLPEKFGRSMDQIHGPVPGFEGGTRNADLINRMFDNLPPGRIVERFNWTVNTDGGLFLPKSNTESLGAASVALEAENTFVRIERQTLRKLPKSGDIVFTIGIHSDPVAVLDGHPDAARLALSFAAQLEELTLEQAAYKGLASKRDSLIAALRGLAGG